MRLFRIPILCVLLGISIAPAAPAARERPAGPSTPPTPRTLFSGTRVIVEWTAGARRGAKVDAREDAGVDFARDLGSRRFQLVQVESGQVAGDAVRELAADPAVVVAERDSYSAPHGVPDDPFFGQLWGLRNTGVGIGGFFGAVPGADIDADGAWARSVGTPTTVVASIDSGYRFEHPDLGPVAWSNPADPPGGGDDDGNGIVDDSRGADFVGPSANSPAVDGDPTDDNLIDGWHGIHTAGTIGAAGNDGVGITGVAQNVRIMPLRVCSYYTDPLPEPLDDSGTLCPASSQIQAINYAGSHGARVANMSLGGTSFSPSLRNALAANPQTLFVISAGNDAEDNDSVPHYPCNYNPLAEEKSTVDNVICVAATDQADGLADFSDWGATSVDLGAPGTETLSAYPYALPFDETFAVDDFGTSWPATGADGGFQRTSEPPLTSFGMTDAIGAPAANTVRETTSASFALPPNGGCSLFQTRRVVLSIGDQYRYSVLLDGVEKASASPLGTSGGGLEARVLDLPPAFEAGGQVQIRFRFTTGLAPEPSAGVWLDDLAIECVEAVGQASGYAFLQGTSMSAPHVTGAAALLFSFEPPASVTEVREALLSSVDPVPSLSGKTVTGGRLDASEALDVFAGDGGKEPPAGEEPSDDGDPAAGEAPPIAPTEVPPLSPSPPADGSSPRAACTVPRLLGKTLRRARAALAGAGCRLGKVTKPKARQRRRQPRLVVRASAPPAAAKPADRTVDLRLGPKPRLKQRHRKHHR